jgi:hypothetical protein
MAVPAWHKIPSVARSDTLKIWQLDTVQCHMEERMSWLGKLEKAKAEMISRDADPWRLRLERARGQVGDDGIERISTQTLFDHLEVFQRGRGAAACRRLAKVMRELGWTAVRVRDLTRGGYKDQVRGYCRDARCP